MRHIVLVVLVSIIWIVLVPTIRGSDTHTIVPAYRTRGAGSGTRAGGASPCTTVCEGTWNFVIYLGKHPCVRQSTRRDPSTRPLLTELVVTYRLQPATCASTTPNPCTNRAYALTSCFIFRPYCIPFVTACVQRRHLPLSLAQNPPSIKSLSHGVAIIVFV